MRGEQVQVFRRMLVPLDFSPHSQRALELAIDLARALGASLDLLHVMELPSEARSLYGVVFAESILEDARLAAAQLLEAPAALARAVGLEVRVHVGMPPAKDAIAARAAEFGTELIVMGTRGRGSGALARLGSVAARTVATAPCPVLTVSASA